jgi:hypothetical protein
MLPDREKLRIADLPDGYTVVGVGDGFFIVRTPGGDDIPLGQDGHLTGVTTRRSFATARAGRLGAGTASAPYTDTMD